MWQSALCDQTVAWSHPYSSQCGQSAPLVLAGYMRVFFFLVSHPSDEEHPCGQTASWFHHYSAHCGQSAPSWGLAGYVGVFFFLASHPNDEETTCSQSAPCGQKAPWSHPYSPQCGQSAPLVLVGYIGVFSLIQPGDEVTPCSEPAPCGQTALSLLIPMWPASTLGVNCLHGGVLLPCESP